MTRKHFEALAVALANTRPYPLSANARGVVWLSTVDGIADVCEASNPAFDRDRFIDACQTYTVAIRDGRLVRLKTNPPEYSNPSYETQRERVERKS